ncbi:MAG: long-chain fatty acid--CoA ligase [Candidatus Latescibacterota bacterium]
MMADTIPQLFLRAVSKYRKKDAFRVKKDGRYRDISHEDAFRSVHHAALGLLALRLAKGDRVALISENRPEWMIADLAILSAGCINVPIYVTVPAKQLEYMLKDSGARAAFVSDAKQLAKLLEVRTQLPALQYVITFDANCDVPGIIQLDNLIRNGASVPSSQSYEEMISAVIRSDWASIVYTSGTTGDPKGAILTHGNFVSNATACASLIDINPTDTTVSFLPLSHVFERTAGYYAMMHAGVTISYAESFDTILQNLEEVKPTVVTSVPRLYEKIYTRIMDSVTSGPYVKKLLFFWALNAGSNYVQQKLSGNLQPMTIRKYNLAKKLVFSKLKHITGGRLRFFVSGGAPLHRTIAEFFYAVDLPILEGYGLTETSPVIAVNTFEQFKFGSVGKPLPGVEIKIAGDGEILVKGPNVMIGYFKKPDLTNEAVVDGWFHTGDIGFLDNEGFLSITDRKKDIIITAGGKNIAPQSIENAIKTSKYIGQVVLIGNRRKFISALIVPNFDNLRKFALAKNITYTDIPSLLKHPQIIDQIQDSLDRKSGDFASFERVKKFVLLDHDFSIEDNELTPSLKIKRAYVEEKYKEAIDKLYRENDG